MNINIKRLFYHFKCLGFSFFVPLIIVNIVIPTLNILVFLKSGITEELYTNILQYTQWLLPFFSVWWVLFVLREYIEPQGNELLYVCKNKCKLTDSIYIFITYIMNIFLLYFAYFLLFSNMRYEFIKILSVCIFYFGLTYFFCFLTKSITLTLMLTILYTLCSIIFSSRLTFPLYYSLEIITLPIFIANYLPLCLIGILLLSLGAVLNLNKLRFV